MVYVQTFHIFHLNILSDRLFFPSAFIVTFSLNRSDLIFDKFAGYVGTDRLFDGISDDLITIVRKKKPSKSEIEKLLRKKQDEDTKSES